MTVAVGGKGVGGGGADKAVAAAIARWKLPLPDVAGQKVGIVGLAIAPGKARPLATAGGRIFPFSLRRQAAAGPGGEGDRVVPGDMHDGMLAPSDQVRMRPLGPLPTGAFDPTPPGKFVAGSHRCGRIPHEGGEHQRPTETFGLRAIAGGVHEGVEPGVRHRQGIDGEGPDPDRARRALAILRQQTLSRADAHAAAGQVHATLRPFPRRAERGPGGARRRSAGRRGRRAAGGARRNLDCRRGAQGGA